MGCSAAKNLTVEPLDGNKIPEQSNNFQESREILHNISNVPPLEVDEPHTELLDSATTLNNIQKGCNGLSFEIAFQEDIDDSIIKRHPPKRFQRLEEQQTGPVITLEKLQEKLEEAEIRRQQILQQRVQSAKYRNALKKQSTVTSLSEPADQDDPDHLKLPAVISQQ